jgi:hypothetical protein
MGKDARSWISPLSTPEKKLLRGELLEEILFLGVITSKDARPRELTIFISFSLALASFPVNQLPRIVVETQHWGELLEKLSFLGVDY